MRSKIFNDPVYGFVTVPTETVFAIVEHPWFQRLRRIQQLGFGSLVYPGAHHTRFQHALGALHLMQKALDVLKAKGQVITDDEYEAACIAILLHDIGHGPYSHALEKTLVPGIHHEDLSIRIMAALDEELGGRLKLAREIFENKYSKGFLHQLVSSQLDVDRLDYLTRDTYFTGVSEGVIGWSRIIDMMDVVDDRLVIEAKGIYSIEKFIIARRIMYWQVYLHKTVLCTEQMLTQTLRRARVLAQQGISLSCTPALEHMLYRVQGDGNTASEDFLNHFTKLDDTDIMTGLKVWQHAEDTLLSTLASGLVNRRLFRLELQLEAFSPEKVGKISDILQEYYDSEDAAEYLMLEGKTSNSAYSAKVGSIPIHFKDGSVKDVTEASDQLNLAALSAPVVKYYLGYPKVLASKG